LFELINSEIFNKKLVLIAPLDWGLGHATRCIPIIKDLISNDCQVIIASSGPQEILLKREFPDLNFFYLEGYNIRYSRSKTGLGIKILLQLPKIILAIYREKKWLNKRISENKIDVIISDNRFGLHHHAIKSIYITHQLSIKTGTIFTNWLAQKFHYHFINKFQECWVPDNLNENNLAGILSHPQKLPRIPVQYIGPVSRFENPSIESMPPNQEKKYDLVILLSGPEPMRTVFEEMLLMQLENYTGKVIIVRGLPGNLPMPEWKNKGIEAHNHLPAAMLNDTLMHADLVICRSGYTTIMDLKKLGLPAILVPTPGQTEQEYLARYLSGKNIFYSVQQAQFNLKASIENATAFYLHARPNPAS
jgi:UDP-N-acetylglucosamine transferase subunit ALG13